MDAATSKATKINASSAVDSIEDNTNAWGYFVDVPDEEEQKNMRPMADPYRSFLSVEIKQSNCLR